MKVFVVLKSKFKGTCSSCGNVNGMTCEWCRAGLRKL